MHGTSHLIQVLYCYIIITDYDFGVNVISIIYPGATALQLTYDYMRTAINSSCGHHGRLDKQDLYNTCIVTQLSRNKYCLNQKKFT